ncbi:MAG: beta-N-acetylhexosaminidase [Akkermansia sp.]
MNIPYFLLGLTVSGMSLLPASADVPVIPRPVKEMTPNGSPLENYAALVQKKDQVCILGNNTIIKASDALQNEKSYIQGILAKLPASPSSKASVINLSIDPSIAKEGYTLKVSPSVIDIVGGDAAGVFYGIQSINQMLIVGHSKGTIAIPAMAVEDAPSTQWRGMMLDTARHYHSPAFIKKFIDLLALHKMNRLHWHLVDSEGWRLEIKKYPKLVEVTKDYPASYPSEDPTDKSRPAVYMYGHFHGGGYYTQDEVKDIVKYAKSRHVEIMPEIEFPGHSMVALTAYPEFGTTGKVPSVKSNISVDLYGPNEKALGFFKDVLDETMALFPFEMIHFGGDEAPKGQWKESPEAQAKIKQLGLKDENELQAWMFNELAKHIAKKGRRPAGWEEIMHGDNMNTLTKTAVVMPWLSTDNAVKSANEGLGIIHSQTGPFYFDSWQTNSPADNWTLYKGPFTLESVYSFNLYPDKLTEKGRKNVYGAQAQLWNELMPKSEFIEYQAFPRAAALAELTWTPENRKDYKDFYKRLINHGKVLDAYNVNYRYINPLPSGEWNASTLSKNTFDIPLPTEKMADAQGEMVVQFDYKKGNSRLNIKSVELLNNGKLVASDEHEGFAGVQSQDNTYRLKFKAKVPGKYSLRITHTNEDKNSEGELTIFTGKGLELFNPANFAGGDYPSAQWTTGETKASVSNLRIPMDGIVKEPGSYELIFNMKQIKAPVIAGDIKIQGTEGTKATTKAIAAMNDKSKTAILPVNIQSQDIKRGNSITFRLKSAQPSAGEVRVRMTKDLQKNSPTNYAWNPEILKSNKTIAYINDFTPTTNGKINISFQFKSGGNALNINAVQIIKNGAIIAESTQKGFAGNNPKDNTYSIESPSIKAGDKYNIRLSIEGAGGSNSHGEVIIN